MAVGMELASAGRMKAAMETMDKRIKRMKEATEKTLDRSLTVGLTVASTGAFGYVNERYGSAPAHDPGGYREVTIMGAPVDLALGGLGVALSFLGVFGKYDPLILPLANGATSASAYRMAAEVGRRQAQAHAQQGSAASAATAAPALGPAPASAPATTTTAGAMASPWSGRTRHVTYAP